MTMKHLFLAGATLAFFANANAQQDTSGTSMNEVVVTATKFSRKASETGKVLTIISKEVLERSAGKDIAQLLTEQAGIVVNGATSNPGKDKSLYLRGAKNDYTVFLVNGVPVNDPTGVGGAFDMRLFPIDQIERIEILKGAQSTLYGSDAIAGVINIITKKGAGKPAQLYGNLAAGSFGTFKATAGLNGTTDKVSYNIGFVHNETKGISEALDKTGTGNFDKDGFRNNAINLSIDGEVMPGLSVKPFFRYSYFSGAYDDGSYADAANSYKSSLLSTGSQFQWKHEKGNLNALFGYDEVTRDYISAYPSEFDGRNHTLDVYGNYEFSPHFEVLAGFDQRWYRTVLPVITKEKMHSSSPYVSVFLKNIFNTLNVELGGRYISNSEFGSHFTYNINPSVLLNNNVKLFANLSTAFKAPSLSQLYGQWGANPDLQPEESVTGEAGVQLSFLQDKINTRITGFTRHIDDVMIYGANGYINFDKQEDYGFEIEPTLKLTKNLQVNLFYTFVNGEVSTQTSGKDTSYFNLLRRPKHSGGVTASYQLTKKLFVSTNYYTYSKRTDMDFSSWPSTQVNLGAYGLWNAYAEYAFIPARLKVFADVKNILDKQYEEVLGYSTQGFNITAGISFKL